MSNSDLDNSRMEIPVSETLPGPSGIKIEPKEDCEDLLSAFTVDPTPVKIENDDISDNSDEYDETLSEDYTVDVKKLKTEHTEDSKEWLNKPLIKSEENDQLAVSGEDQDDNFTEDSNIKSEEMHIKEDDGFNEPGMSPNSYDQDAPEVRRTTNKTNPVFQCPDCDFNSTRKLDMARHVAQHKRKPAPKYGLFPCNKCNFKATTMTLLKEHLLRHLSFEEAFEYNCDMCEYTTVYKSRIERHLRAHKKKGGLPPRTMFACNQCSYKTKNKHYLAYHLRVRHGNHDNLTKYSCPDCDYTTIYQGRFKLHSQVHLKPVLKCYHCSYETASKTYLKSHLQRHRKKSGEKVLFKEHLRLNCGSQNAENIQESDMCRNSCDQDVQKVCTMKKTQTVFQCPNCEYNTTRKRDLRTHLYRHKKIQSSTIFACTECDYEGSTKSNLKYHLLRHRNPEDVNKHKCDKCKYATMHKSHLKRHLQVHAKKRVYTAEPSTEPPLQCDKCEYQTKNKRCLALHYVIHYNPDDFIKCDCSRSECDSTTIPILKCYHCSYETSSKSNLRQHLVGHLKSPKSEVKSWKDRLNEHLRLNCDLKKRDSQNAENKQTSVVNVSESVDNSKFECQNCSYKTNSQSSFTIHLQQHEKGDFKTISTSNRTAYTCSKCEYTTDLIEDMKCHSLAHTLFERSKGGVIKKRIQQGSSKETMTHREEDKAVVKKDLLKTVVKKDL